MTWLPMKDAPKDGTTIKIKTIYGGKEENEVMFKGLASYRSEDKPALYDPLSGKCFSKETTIVGWMRHDSPYRTPGIPVGWKKVKKG